MEKHVISHAGVKGMRWGVRRFQNPDGSLTEAGKKRYNRDTRDLSDAKKKKYTADTDKWVKSDLESAKSIANDGSNLAGKLKTMNDRSSKKSRPRMNLDNMTDQEMRAKINRELLERQYNDVFNPAAASKGRARLSKTLEVAGDVLGVAGTALGIALSIKALRNGS